MMNGTKSAPQKGIKQYMHIEISNNTHRNINMFGIQLALCLDERTQYLGQIRMMPVGRGVPAILDGCLHSRCSGVVCIEVCGAEPGGDDWDDNGCSRWTRRCSGEVDHRPQWCAAGYCQRELGRQGVWRASPGGGKMERR